MRKSIKERQEKEMQKNRNLIRCPICESVNIDTDDEVRCRRCKEKIYSKKNISYNRTIAFLLTAIILYFPANLYPILITKQLGVTQESTILGGIMLLWEAGSYPVAIIILVASVFVPLLKFIFIIYLLISTKYNLRASQTDKHKLFYITEAIGSWSMIDVFVVTILSVLIHFTAVKIIPGEGATAFALMVFFTMLSALSFDTRLLKKERN